MARRKSHQPDEEETNAKPGRLKPPFSGKVGGNKYVIYADTKKQDEDHPRILVKSFLAEYAARFFINKLIGAAKWQWDQHVGGRACIVTTDGVRISMFGDDLKKLLDYEMTEQEAAWTDEQTAQSAMMLRFGQNFEVKKQAVVEEIIEDEETGETKVVKVKQKKEKKEKKAKIDKSGSVTAQDLAGRLKIEPRIFRGFLRSLKLPKPEGGWHWPKDEAEKIFKQVEAAMKKAKKK
jgi:hypothetical protein